MLRDILPNVREHSNGERRDEGDQCPEREQLSEPIPLPSRCGGRCCESHDLAALRCRVDSASQNWSAALRATSSLLSGPARTTKGYDAYPPRPNRPRNPLFGIHSAKHH